MKLTGLRFRWINCQNFEIQLPNGKRILTDPYVHDALPGHCEPHKTPFTADDYEGADYVIIQHTHFDHDFSSGDVYNRFGSKFIVHESVAYDFGLCFDIPYTNIYTYATETKMNFGDFTLETFKGFHSVNRWISGRPSETEDGGILHFGVGGHERLERLGTLFNSSYVVTTRENLRIGFLAGEQMQDVLPRVEQLRPNVLLVQFSGDVQNAVEWIMQSGAALTIPMHHETALFRGMDVEAKVSEVNRILEKRGCSGRMLYPQRYRWYSYGCFAELEE